MCLSAVNRSVFKLLILLVFYLAKSYQPGCRLLVPTAWSTSKKYSLY